MNGLLLTLLSMSVSGALVILLILAVRLVARRRIPRAFQYYIWLIAILRLIVPLTPETSLVGRIFAPHEAVAAVGTPVGYPEELSEIPVVTPMSQLPAATAPSAPVAVPSAPEPAVPEPPVASFDLAAFIADNLLTIWALGALIMLGVTLLSYARLIRAVRKARRVVTDGPLFDAFSECRGMLGIYRDVPLYTSKLVGTPMLVGLLRTQLILPEREFGDEARFMLLHELIHLRRRDILLKWLAQLVVCVHWFNPLVHIMARELDRACELACDEAVAAALTPEERTLYGETLIAVGALSRPAPAAVCMSEDGKRLKERLEAIIEFSGKSVKKTVVSVVVVLVLCTGAFFAGAHIGPGLSAPPTPPAEVTPDPDVELDALRELLEDNNQQYKTSSVVELPRLLHIKTDGSSAIGITHDFTLEQDATMDISVITDSGTVEIGIRDKVTGEYVFPPRRFDEGREDESVTLAPGFYSVELTVISHVGSYTVAGVPLSGEWNNGTGNPAYPNVIYDDEFFRNGVVDWESLTERFASLIGDRLYENAQLVEREFSGITDLIVSVDMENVRVVRGGDSLTVRYYQWYDGQFSLEENEPGALNLTGTEIRYGTSGVYFPGLMGRFLANQGKSLNHEDMSDLNGTIVITVPESVELDYMSLYTSDGSIDTQVGARMLAINCYGGKITVKGASGSAAAIDGGNGGVSLSDMSGWSRISVDNSYGSVHVSGVNATNLIISSTAKYVSVVDSSGINLQISAISGFVSLTGADGWLNAQISTVEGAITLREDELDAFNVKYTTISGKLPHKDIENLETGGPDATRTMTVSTVSGDVTLR